MSLHRPLALVAALALLGACATIPQPLQGKFATSPLPAPSKAVPAVTHVRWGGEIIKVEPGAQQTCFDLLSRPLDNQARPQAGDRGENQGASSPAATASTTRKYLCTAAS